MWSPGGALQSLGAGAEREWGLRGERELARGANVGQRVGVGLAGSKAGQGELSVATKSLIGQGPWQRQAGGICREPHRPGVA